MKVSKIVLGFMISVFLLGISLQAKADSLGFSVSPIFPKNQIAGDSNYYNLKMNAGESQIIKINLTNTSDSEVKLKALVSPVTTNANGIVEYVPNNIKADPSLKYNMHNLVEIPADISLPAKTSKIIDVKVNMPGEGFEGIIAGGIVFKNENQEKAAKNDKGVSLKNEYQYAVGLLIRQSETKIAPNVLFHDIKVEQNDTSQKNTVAVNIQNDKATYVNQMVVKAKIVKTNDPNIKMEYQSNGMQMAPNSNFSPSINLDKLKNNQGIVKGGEYKVDMDVYSEEDANGIYKNGSKSYKYHWNTAKTFQIEQANIEPVAVETKVAVPADKNNTWLVGLFAGILAILLAGGGYFGYKKWRS